MRIYSRDDSYRAWVENHDSLSDSDSRAIRDSIPRLPRLPVFSLMLLPTPGGVTAAREMIASLERQIYPYWEILLADAPSERSPPAPTADSRVRFLPGHSGAEESIASIVNAGVRMAIGDFILPVLPDVVLRPHSLYELAVVVGKDPNVAIIYTDEDQIVDSGERRQPRFKTGWDPDLALGRDAFGMLVAYHRALLLDLGEIELHAQDLALASYELSLQAAFATLPSQIHHVPAVLCHRRGNLPVSQDGGAEATRAVLRRHLAGCGIAARVVAAPLAPAWNWVLRDLPDPAPLVSIIVPTRDRAELLERCAASILGNTDYPHLELLIVDNDSREPETADLFKRLAEDSRVRIVACPGTFNYSGLNNLAAGVARGEILVLLNNDTASIRPDWLREMVAQALRLDVGAVGAKLLYENEQVQHAGMVFQPGVGPVHQFRFADRWDAGPGGELALTRAVSIVTGACLALRRSLFLEVGGLDEELTVAYNDVDLCMRLGDRGYRIIWTPVAELFHFEGMSRGYDDTPEKAALSTRELAYFSRRWGSLLQTDPFRNQNLDFQWDAVTLSTPPLRPRAWL